ncbi:uncharacterized protein LOC109841700 [Asparagus officinalis]|uniref:uncharacterized protein LOC109841700 n=1 Tax=Asparagus officinalis TaxID=4686 RepID=UPI00098E2EBB|nr:uncharacterized protein LOC109841700 [Asparagus officinalis]
MLKQDRPGIRARHQQQGQFKRRPPQDQRRQQQHKFQGTCHNCQKFGHRAAECRSAPRGGQQQGRGHGQQQNHGQGQQQQQGRAYGQQQRRIEAPPVIPRIEGPTGQIRAIQEIPEAQMAPYAPPPPVQQLPATGRVYAVIPHDQGASGAIVEGGSEHRRVAG